MNKGKWTSNDIVTIEGVIIEPRQVLLSLVTGQQYEVLNSVGGLWIVPIEDGRIFSHLAFCIVCGESFSYVSHPEKEIADGK